jgi:hypothetical protein
MMHFDSELSCVKELVAVGLYSLPPGKLREAVLAKSARGGKKGVAFEISEDLPVNWQETIPIVLKTLNEI